MINPREVVTLIRVKFGLMIKEGATLIMSCLNFIMDLTWRMIDNSDLFPARRLEGITIGFGNWATLGPLSL